MGDVWRLIESGPCSAAFNMALDEAIAMCVRRNDLSPVLRLYGWDRPSLSLGCFQKVSEVDAGYCRARSIPIVRRPTGGRAILHDEELTYSVVAATGSGPFSRGLLDSYRKMAEAFRLAFRKLGVNVSAKDKREKGSVLAGSPLCFQSSSYGEILIENRKVVGSAQKRWEDGMLQQGSIPFAFREDDLRGIFGAGRHTAMKECTAGLRDVLPGVGEARFRETIVSSFGETFSVRFVPDRPSEEELSLARQLEEEKYLQDDWNFRR